MVADIIHKMFTFIMILTHLQSHYTIYSSKSQAEYTIYSVVYRILRYIQFSPPPICRGFINCHDLLTKIANIILEMPTFVNMPLDISRSNTSQVLRYPYRSLVYLPSSTKKKNQKSSFLEHRAKFPKLIRFQVFGAVLIPY